MIAFPRPCAIIIKSTNFIDFLLVSAFPLADAGRLCGEWSMAVFLQEYHPRNPIQTYTVQRVTAPAPAMTGSAVSRFGFDFSRVPAHAPAATAAPAPQPPLTVGAPGDGYEQAADRAAGQVMRMPEPLPGGQERQADLPRVQPAGVLARRAISSGAGASGAGAVAVPPSVHETLRAAGQPLDAQVRSFMEPRFGDGRFDRDFSRVRVHTDARAAQSASEVNALAYAVGDHLIFGPGQYAPESTPGKALIAHELAHVVQQQSAPTAPPVLRRVPQKASTWAGTFTADPYKTIGQDENGKTVGYGVRITLCFEPNKFVDAEKISFVQNAISIKDGKVSGKNSLKEKEKKVIEGRTLPAGKEGAGAHIDVGPATPTPLYGMSSLGAGLEEVEPAKGFDITPDAEKDTGCKDQKAAMNKDNSVTQIGWRYVGPDGKLRIANPIMRDQPILNSGDIYTEASDAMVDEWHQQFETTALATAGHQAGAYYGSVEWGWSMKKTDVLPTLKDFKTKSSTAPSPVFMEAARLWNASTTSDNKPTADLPVDTTWLTPGSVTLWDSPDRRKKIAVLPKNTLLSKTLQGDPQNRVGWVNVVVLEGANTGKMGWLDGVLVKADAAQKKGK
jgi:hypothetical protein